MTQASNKKEQIKSPLNGRKIKPLKKRKMITIATDERFDADLAEAKDKTGITATSQVIRAGIKNLIKE